MPPRDKSSQGARDRAAIAADLKRADRMRVKALRARVRELKRARVEGVRQVRQTCRGAIGELRARKAELLAQIRELTKRIQQRAARCKGYVDATQARSMGELAAARAELEDKLREIARETTWTKRATLAARSSSRSSAAKRAAELRAESDDAVRANLPPDLVPVFDRVRRSIKGTPRMTRTERFLEWAAEHPADVWEIQREADHRAMVAHDRELRELERAARNGRYKQHPARLASELERRAAQIEAEGGELF